MHRYILSKLVQMLLVLMGVLFIVFFMVRLTGDPTRVILSREATQEQVEEFKHKMGWDRPLLIQFIDFVGNAFIGNFGDSLLYRTPALPLILERIPATVELAVVALFMAIIIGIPLGLFAGVKPDSPIDYFSRAIGLFGQTIPTFWLSLMMIILFAIELHWLPTSGRDSPKSILMPAFALCLPTLGRLVRLTRSSIVEIMGEDYIRTVKSKGLEPRIVFFRHALRNAGIILVSVIGIQFTYMLGGSVVIESVFAWPGLGRMAADAVAVRDFPLIQGIAFFASVITVIVTFSTDLVYAFINPKIRFE
jgi:ABC-type dipeptide/oligopeptide/nickel transport system permease component